SNFPTTGFDTTGAQVSTGEASNANPIMFVAMHDATSSDWPTLVTMHDGNNVWAYNIVPSDPAYLAAAKTTPLALGLWDLSPWMSSLQISQAAVVTVPTTMQQQYNAHPVWSGRVSGQNWPGRLYWSFVNSQGGVSAFQWPMRGWQPTYSALLSSTA